MESNLNIALCLSGQPRGLPLCLSFLKKNIIEPNNIKHVFFHTWHDEKDVGKPYNSTQVTQNGLVGTVRAKTAEILKKVLEPTACVIEPQKSFEHLKHLISHPTANQEILGSQLYSTYIANELRKETEVSAGFQFDVVLRTRFDLFYSKPIILKHYIQEIEQGKIVVMKKFQEDQERFQSPDSPMTDIFAFGNSHSMNIFSSVYPEMQRLNPLLQNPFSENYHGRFVRIENKIDLALGDFDFNLMQRVMRIS